MICLLPLKEVLYTLAGDKLIWRSLQREIPDPIKYIYYIEIIILYRSIYNI